ncbi:NfeD family protein [Nonomuraea dietziae]|uniref:NfeD family protein n=1 Tax=Nonomuraea dietziae TaxID=65515 RepID=UPI00336CAEBF
MDDWVIWIILAVVLGVAEIFSLTAALGLLGVSALLTAMVAAIGLPIPIQLLVFTLTSVAGLVVIRPLAMRNIRQPQLQRFGVDALVGKSAYVVKEVTGRQGPRPHRRRGVVGTGLRRDRGDPGRGDRRRHRDRGRHRPRLPPGVIKWRYS